MSQLNMKILLQVKTKFWSNVIIL